MLALLLEYKRVIAAMYDSITELDYRIPCMYYGQRSES